MKLTPKMLLLYKDTYKKLINACGVMPSNFTEEEYALFIAEQEEAGMGTDMISHFASIIERQETPEPSKPSTDSAYSAATKITFKYVNEMGATHSPYGIMMRLLDTPEYQALGNSQYMMAHQFGAAMNSYFSNNRVEIQSFVKGIPPTPEGF